MARTFHHRFTLGSKCGIILFALIALYLFWVKAVIVGFLLVVLNVMVIERVLHSEYIIDDDTLTVYRGRFAKSRVIPLADIKSCRPVNTGLGLAHFLLLEYGQHKYVSLEPDQEASFIKCLRSRMAAPAQAEATPNAPED